jgi:hypothetical protein
MSITIYIPKENGDLKYVAEVDEVTRPEMALDALLDEMPRVARQSDTFVALNGTLEDGQMVTMVLDVDAPVEERPKRSITVSINGRVEQPVAAPDETGEPDEPAPAPKRRRAARKSSNGRKRTASKATASKAGTSRRGPGRGRAQAASGRKSSPFKARPDED